MKRLFLIVLLSVTMLSSSGCILGMAALIRWDHMRWKAQQEKLREQEERDRESSGSCPETDGGTTVPEVPEPVSGESGKDSVPVPGT
jgi:uncharacterized protein YbbK (DUF523 family)